MYWIKRETPRRIIERDRRDEGESNLPRHAFRARLARHAPQSVALADFLSILLGKVERNLNDIRL